MCSVSSLIFVSIDPFWTWWTAMFFTFFLRRTSTAMMICRLLWCTTKKIILRKTICKKRKFYKTKVDKCFKPFIFLLLCFFLSSCPIIPWLFGSFQLEINKLFKYKECCDINFTNFTNKYDSYCAFFHMSTMRFGTFVPLFIAPATTNLCVTRTFQNVESKSLWVSWDECVAKSTSSSG